jgi:hypothetical protein
MTMKLHDDNLQDAINSLSGRDREALEAAVNGRSTAAGLQILQTVKARLKRKARAGKPRKIRLNKDGQPRKPHGTGRAPGQGVNATAIRNGKIARATKAEEEAARANYEEYKRRLRAIHMTAEGFDSYFAEWLDTRRAEAIEGAQGNDAERYERRDYGVIYRAGDRWIS